MFLWEHESANDREGAATTKKAIAANTKIHRIELSYSSLNPSAVQTSIMLRSRLQDKKKFRDCRAAGFRAE